MKKLLLMFTLLCACITINAGTDSGSGSCIIRGTSNDYVEATAYLTASNGEISGYVNISNSSSKPLMSYRLTVTAEVVTVYSHGNLTWTTKTFCDQTYHKKCEPYSDTSIELKTLSGHAGYVRNVRVSISNPTCDY